MALADGESLVSKTLRRALSVVDGGEIWTVTSEDYYFLTRDHYAKLDDAGVSQRFVLEPVGRNTAPAILAAAMAIGQQHGEEAVLLVLPADHLIKDLAGFRASVATALALARDGYLVTFGIQPDHAETGYGYIRVGNNLDGGFDVRAFVEKPDRPTAQSYLDGGDYLWNSGMFCFAAGALIGAASRHCPELQQSVANTLQATNQDENPMRLDREHFAANRSISIDYAVMEHAQRRAVVAADFDWSDIGGWPAVSKLADADAAGNRVPGDAVLVDCKGCYVQSTQRVIAGVGLRNTVIVDTEDALLVADNSACQDVKEVVERLRASDHPTAVFHQTVHRPWGTFTVLEDRPNFKVKRLEVKPGQVLSLQRHQRRSEHWTVVAGRAKVRCADDESILVPNQSVEIPVNTLHRLENPDAEGNAVVIEVQCGDYFGEDDIERFEDIYGRA